MAFVDRAQLYVKGGDGGNGCLSFRREKYVPHGGPDGGEGGHGGSVVIQVVPGTDSLADLSFRRHWVAESGSHGQGQKKTGRRGKDLIIAVPPGALIRDREHGFVLKDLTEPDAKVTVARGGKGGKGNTAFASATNRVPREFERGHAGEERWIVLELKLIADVGLVGLPNAGKSTLLSRLSRAHPEIADYPFTTKYPNLGMCRLGPDQHCVLADIPGLIEGAHAGVGLGHEFLRHVERTRVLVHLVECQPSDGSRPLDNYRAVCEEMKAYDPKLSRMPELVAISKSELTDPAPLVAEFRRELDRPVMAISAVTGLGLRELCGSIAQLLDESSRSDPASADLSPP